MPTCPDPLYGGPLDPIPDVSATSTASPSQDAGNSKLVNPKRIRITSAQPQMFRGCQIFRFYWYMDT